MINASRCGDEKVAQIISHPTKVVLNNSNLFMMARLRQFQQLLLQVQMVKTASDSANYDISYIMAEKMQKYDVKVTFKGNYTGSLTTVYNSKG